MNFYVGYWPTTKLQCYIQYCNLLLARIHTSKTQTKSTRTQKHILTVDTATAGQCRTNPWPAVPDWPWYRNTTQSLNLSRRPTKIQNIHNTFALCTVKKGYRFSRPQPGMSQTKLTLVWLVVSDIPAGTGKSLHFFAVWLLEQCLSFFLFSMDGI
jgi:hypothetical protein